MKTEDLTRALRSYAEHSRSIMYTDPVGAACPNFAVVVGEYPRRRLLHLDEAMHMAANWLDQRDIDAMKFRALVAGMKERGADRLYEYIMREKIPA